MIRLRRRSRRRGSQSTREASPHQGKPLLSHFYVMFVFSMTRSSRVFISQNQYPRNKRTIVNFKMESDSLSLSHTCTRAHFLFASTSCDYTTLSWSLNCHSSCASHSLQFKNITTWFQERDTTETCCCLQAEFKRGRKTRRGKGWRRKQGWGSAATGGRRESSNNFRVNKRGE